MLIPKPLVPHLQRVRFLIFITLYTLLKLVLPRKHNAVALLSNSRDDLSGNLEYLYNEICKQDIKVEILTKKKIGLKGGIRLIYILATVPILIIDDYFPIIYSIKLRKGTELIQAWHACGAFKTFGFSRIGKPGGPSPSSLTHRNYTQALVSSEHIIKDYAEGFGIDKGKVKALGIPRSDMFFDKELIKQKKTELLNKYPMLKDKKLITFAPTFRGNGRKSAYYDFSLIDWEGIYREFSEEYVFIIKLHPFIKNITEIQLPKGSESFFIDLTSEREINDLLLITDILITDYSSVIFEYSLLQRPLLFFVPDLEEYIAHRDFYYPFEEYVYGEVVKNPNDLVKGIKNAKVDKKKLTEFHKKFMGACDGQASKRIVEKLIMNTDD